VWHIAIDGDRYFDNKVVEQHLKIIYDDVQIFKGLIQDLFPGIEIAPKND
jgi:hypothetical protein